MSIPTLLTEKRKIIMNNKVDKINLHELSIPKFIDKYQNHLQALYTPAMEDHSMVFKTVNFNITHQEYLAMSKNFINYQSPGVIEVYLPELSDGLTQGLRKPEPSTLDFTYYLHNSLNKNKPGWWVTIKVGVKIDNDVDINH